MSANLRYYIGTMYELDHVMRLVRADAWDAASPCEGWTARQVAGHAIGICAQIPARLGVGPAVDAFGDVAPLAGDDPVSAFRTARATTMRALDTPGSLSTRVPSSMGEMTLDEFLAPLGRDALVHAWDIARATGVAVEFDPDLVRGTLERTDPGALSRAPGRYGEIVEVAPDADALARLLALTGRDPGWTG